MPNSDLTAMTSTSLKTKSPIDSGIDWILRLIPAFIIGRAALMKFLGGAQVSKVFELLDMEPNGRILIAIIEAICVILLLSSRLSAWGAILCIGVMVGAVIAHASVLGFEGTAGKLFMMAVVSTISSTVLLYRLRHEVPFIRDMFNA